MKTLLVCTDFSEPATHAASYACMLASQYKLPYITLFHAWHDVPVTATTPPLDTNLNDEEAKASLQQLKDLKDRLGNLTDKNTMIRIRSEKMSLAENINQLCKEENADIVVMGVSGKSKLEKAFIGSNTVNVSRTSKYPVLIVPAKAPLQPVSHIVFACDLDEVQATTPLDPLNRIMELFHSASLTILNADSKNRHFSPQTPEEMYQMHHIFDKFKPKYAFIDSKDKAEGIMDYAERNNISLIITVPKNYNFLQQLFHSSTTKELIYKSAVPLLTLHE